MYRILFLLLLSINCFAQGGDVLLLQKHHRTVGHFFVGSSIIFYTGDGKQVAGKIDSLRRDSIFLVQQSEWMVPNGFGTYTPMKGPAVVMKFAIADIAAFPPPPQKFGLFRSGTIFIVGGAAYLVLNAVNTVREKDKVFGKDNLPRVVGGLSSVALGLILKATQRTSVKLHGKYQLKILTTTTIQTDDHN